MRSRERSLKPPGGVACTAASVPKDGNTAEENEDAVVVDNVALPVQPGSWRYTFPGNAVRIAIADGASTSPRPGEWARTLARAAAAGSCRDLRDTFASARATFAEQQRSRAQLGGPLSWYQQARAAEPSFATLVLAEVELQERPVSGRGRCWVRQPPRVAAPEVLVRASAVGDSCAFFVREDRSFECHPQMAVGDFRRAPDLVGSDDQFPVALPLPREATAVTRAYLATDALAEWILRRGAAAFDALDEVLDRDEFAGWVAHAREEGDLRDDDTTVVRVRRPVGW